MRTQGINLHVAHRCFSLPSSISSPPSPSSRRRTEREGGFGNDWKRPEGSLANVCPSKRSAGLSIDRWKKGRRRRVKREKRIVCTRALENFFPRENSFSASHSRRVFFHEKFLEREKKRESFFLWRGDLWTKIVGGTGADENISRENWSFVGFLSNIRFVCVYVVHLWKFDNVFISLSYFSGTKFIGLLVSWIYRGQFLFRDKRNLTRWEEVLEELEDHLYYVHD